PRALPLLPIALECSAARRARSAKACAELFEGPCFGANLMDAKTRIRALNDELRQHLAGGTALTTPVGEALGQAPAGRIFKTSVVFDDFCHANDPHEEHDFGAFEVDGHAVMFKIDYYDKDLCCHSPDPADPAVTKRVITIMLA